MLALNYRELCIYVCVHVCVCVCFFSPLFVVFSSAIATYSNQHCPQFTTWSHTLAKATSIQLPPAGTPLGNRHSARVSDIAAFTANICYSQPLKCRQLEHHWETATQPGFQISLPSRQISVTPSHSARVSDIAAFMANICYFQPPLIMVPVSLPFMANTEEPFFSPLHAVLP